MTAANNTFPVSTWLLSVCNTNDGFNEKYINQNNTVNIMNHNTNVPTNCQALLLPIPEL